MKTIFTAFLCLIAMLSFADVTNNTPFDSVGHEQLAPTKQETGVEVTYRLCATTNYAPRQLSGVLVKPLFGYIGKLFREKPMRLFWNNHYRPIEQANSTYG